MGTRHRAPREEPHKAGHHPAELRGRDAKGNVRPADNRYLSHEEIAQRDDYVAQETGPEAQQLRAKAEAPDHVKALNSRDRGTQ